MAVAAPVLAWVDLTDYLAGAAKGITLGAVVPGSDQLIVGVPDYDLYLAHMRRTHPDAAPMSREAFFANRLEARYARGASRCC